MKTRLLGFAALVALIGVVAGVPWLLLRWGADLTPDQLTLAAVLDVLLRPDDGTVALAAITVIAWIAWASSPSRSRSSWSPLLRGVAAPRLPGFGWPQWGAHQLVAAAALLFATASLASSPPARPPHRRRRPRRARHQRQRAAGSAPAARRLTSRTPAVGRIRESWRRPGPIVVRTGDTLWGLAERYLGDGTPLPRTRPAQRRPTRRPTGPPAPRHAAPHPQRVRPRPAADGDRASAATPCPGSPPANSATRAATARSPGRPGTSPNPAEQQLTDPDVIDIGWKLRIPADDPSTIRDGSPAGDHQADRRSDADQPGPAAVESRPAATHRPIRPDPDPHRRPRRRPRPQRRPPPAPHRQRPRRLYRPSRMPRRSMRAGRPRPGCSTGLTGGGAMLAGGLLIALRQRRRSQWRSRKARPDGARPDHRAGAGGEDDRRRRRPGHARPSSSSTTSCDGSPQPAPPPAT